MKIKFVGKKKLSLSVGAKIIAGISLALILACVGIGVSSYLFSANTMQTATGKQLESMAKVGATVVEKALET